ncbi:MULTISPECIES: helix-turn-helix domain-containing protein [unclassified Streptomyces]|uniref:helix-turn-helix domain-containing protein n=1 Tax=unclassified Streptomyces TaxID=2593676 RepID=UPI0038284989
MTAEVRLRRTPPPGFGQALAEARRTAGLGLREAARRVGVSSGYLAALEAGTRCPSVSVAEQLAEVLGLGAAGRAVVLAAAVDDAGRDHPARRADKTTDLRTDSSNVPETDRS